MRSWHYGGLSLMALVCAVLLSAGVSSVPLTHSEHLQYLSSTAKDMEKGIETQNNSEAAHAKRHLNSSRSGISNITIGLLSVSPPLKSEKVFA